MKKLDLSDLLNSYDKFSSEGKAMAKDAAQMMAGIVDKYDKPCAERLRKDGLPIKVICGSMLFNSMYSSLNVFVEVTLAEHKGPGFICMIWPDKENVMEKLIVGIHITEIVIQVGITAPKPLNQISLDRKTGRVFTMHGEYLGYGKFVKTELHITVNKDE
jgi:hypothetical protein